MQKLCLGIEHRGKGIGIGIGEKDSYHTDLVFINKKPQPNLNGLLMPWAEGVCVCVSQVRLLRAMEASLRSQGPDRV